MRTYEGPTRKLTLTEAGRSYLDAVERILSEVDEADAIAAAQTAEVRGTLRLNAQPPAKIRSFIDFLVKCLGPIPRWDRELRKMRNPQRTRS